MDAVFQSIPIGQLKESPRNTRKVFEEQALEELTSSVRDKGILNPLLVRPNGSGYEILAGARRYRAAKAANLEAAPAIVRELDDKAALELMIIDNLQRSDLHPLEEAEGYRQLMAQAKYDVARIAARVGRSVQYVYDRLKLLSLTKEAQALFHDGRIQAGHAVILARLKPADQKRAIAERGALFDHERLLWDPNEDRSAATAMRRDDAVKPVSVRELQGWIDKNVRFDREEVEPMLFPETAATLTATREVAEKIIPITHDHYVTPEAKVEGERTYGPMSWRRADGKGKSKLCDSSVTGVIVVGPGRGEAFKVCTDKKGCKVHWGAEQRQAQKRAAAATKGGSTGEDRYKLEEEKRKRERAIELAKQDRWKKAAPKILEAIAAAVKKAPARAAGLLGETVLDSICDHRPEREAAIRFVARGTTAEDLVRHAAFLVLAREAGEWGAWDDFPKRAKAFGIDVAKILDEVAPLEASGPAKEQPKKAAKKKR